VKSSLSEARDKVSHHFFKDIYESDLKRLNNSRKTYRGFYIYAVDGDDLNLPRSKGVLEQGYKGHPYAKDFETHYPKMYTVFAYDVLSGLLQRFAYASKYQELNLALELSPSFEKNSITIYDRYYSGYPLMAAHAKAGSHCLIRIKTNGDKTALPVRKFLASDKLDMDVEWFSSKNKKQDPIKIRLVKFINPRTKKMMVFATTLSRDAFSRKELVKLYQKRWEIETTFKDLTHTLKMDQWHSKKINGILQEVYALLWFINNIKIQMTSVEDDEDFLKQNNYCKSNFKLCAKLVIDNIFWVISGQYKKLRDLLIFWISRTIEKRIHRSRSYPRIVKGKRSKFPVHSKVPRTKAS